MKFAMVLPIEGGAAEGPAVIALAQAAEAAGFDMLSYTDHPAPARKWLTTGGHPTFDPFAALAFVAAVTQRIRVSTFLAVLPYRNPLLLAKSVATVDRLSGGRFTLVAGTGYLKSEFSALGASFDERNARFDEAIDVLRRVFTDDEFELDGSAFSARGVMLDPKPVQLPHPPIWIGGNSGASRRRVAEYGAGWAPLVANEPFARLVRSAALPTDDDLAHAIDELRALVAAAGRDPNEVSVQLYPVGAMDDPPERILERVEFLGSIGVTQIALDPPPGPLTTRVEAIHRYGEEVIASTTAR